VIVLGLALALGSAVALNWGWLEQHGAARELPRLTLRRPLTSLRTLFCDRTWVVGFSVGLGGWALYVAALALAPLSLVQATSAGGIGLLAALARRRGGVIDRFQWWAVAGAAAGLVLIAVSLPGGAVSAKAPQVGAFAAWLCISGALAAVTFFGRGGVASGTLYAAGDVATKAAVFGGGWLAAAPLVLAAHGLAFVALQLGFQRGEALETAGAASLLTNALPIAAGLAIFGEHLPGGALGVVRVMGFVLVTAAAVVLTRGRQEHDAVGDPLAAPGPRIEERALVRAAGEGQQ
jgi:hypothetical protein